jgi:uncharacterized membrane protein
MLLFGPLLLITGILLAAFNKRLTHYISGRRRSSDSFRHSVARQNTVIIAAVAIIGGIVMIYLGLR